MFDSHNLLGGGIGLVTTTICHMSVFHLKYFHSSDFFFSENIDVVTQPQPTWQRQVGTPDCTVNTNVLPEDELAIDEGTITVSSIYSQKLVSS